ncbi:MAG: sugar phosphate isomerase/epimerase [Candidatus Hydrogenedentes bacterium]|nr:sugar phosphate isomerase/epimerase [Candidatus Hydrogenedentota bacterium]
MQVGISQLILGKTGCAEFFEQAAAAGYEVVEICMRREGEVTRDMDDGAARRIVDQAAAAGVQIVSMTHSHCTGNLLDTGEAQQRSIDETVAGLGRAAAMGIGCTLHTLGSLRADLYYDEAYRNGIASLKAIAPHAERLGVTLAVEFVWNGFLFSPVEMKAFLDEVGSDRIGFYFDPGNMAVFQFPHHWVHALGRHVKMVHLKDWRGRALNGGWTPLLEGEVDFAAVLRELRAAGYDGPLISEVEPALAPLDVTAKAVRSIIAL